MKRNSSGQALLVIILALAAIVTVVLSVVARSVTDIRTTAKQEESVRAFSAAEAGVERALVSGTLGGAPITDAGELENAHFSATVVNFAQGSNRFVHPKEVFSGDSATVWFVSHDPVNGNLVCNSPSLPCTTASSIRVCWGNAGSPSNSASTPAIEFSVLYDPNANGNYNDLAIARATYDPNGSRRSSNSFAAPDSGSCTIDGTTFAFQKTISFASIGVPAAAYNSANGLQLAKLRLLYNTTTAHTVGVEIPNSASGNRILPGQGRRIESTGYSADNPNDAESSRKVEVYTLYSDIPSVFDSVVYSPAGIQKN